MKNDMLMFWQCLGVIHSIVILRVISIFDMFVSEFREIQEIIRLGKHESITNIELLVGIRSSHVLLILHFIGRSQYLLYRKRNLDIKRDIQ